MNLDNKFHTLHDSKTVFTYVRSSIDVISTRPPAEGHASSLLREYTCTLDHCAPSEGKEEILKAATDPCLNNKEEHGVEMPGLHHLDEKRPNDGHESTITILRAFCYAICFKPLSDYFAQCAEDNATIALMKYLKNNYPSKKVASVEWFSTAAEWSEGGDFIKVTHKPLCGVCAIRFKDRLEQLLSSQVSALFYYKDAIGQKKVTSNIKINKGESCACH